MCDFEIFDRPDKGGLNGYTHFAVKSLAIDGKKTGFVFGEGTLGFDATDIERGITIKTTGA